MSSDASPAPAPAPAPGPANDAWLREAADIEDRQGPIGAAGHPDDARWIKPIGIPSEAFSKVADLAGSGTPIHHLVNVAVYGLAPNGKRRVSPRQALDAFEATLALVIANGQLAAEAMWQAGFPRAEIDDRITRFTSALHTASTSNLPGMPTKSSWPAGLQAGAVSNPASGHKPEAAVSSSSGAAGAVTFPAPAVSAT